jgi:hypothetical protein
MGVNAFMGGDDSGLEEEFEYYPNVSPSEDGALTIRPPTK